jgi:hypothetical protein
MGKSNKMRTFHEHPLIFRDFGSHFTPKSGLKVSAMKTLHNI